MLVRFLCIVHYVDPESLELSLVVPECLVLSLVDPESPGVVVFVVAAVVG